MREVNKKVIDVRNPTHIVLKADEISADDINNLSDSDNPSVLQIASQTELPNEEEQQGEEVKVERTTGEDIPERKDMGRATSMDGKSNWSKAGKNYEFDASLKKTRNQLDVLKAPPKKFGDLDDRMKNPDITYDEPKQEPLAENIDAYYDEHIEPKVLQARNRMEETYLIPQAEFHAMTREFNTNATSLKKLVMETLDNNNWLVESNNKGLIVNLKSGKPTDIDTDL